jgi:hypothetical protein
MADKVDQLLGSITWGDVNHIILLNSSSLDLFISMGRMAACRRLSLFSCQAQQLPKIILLLHSIVAKLIPFPIGHRYKLHPID